MAKINIPVRTVSVPEVTTPARVRHSGGTFYVEKVGDGGWLFGDAGTIRDSRKAQELIELLKLVRNDLRERGL